MGRADDYQFDYLDDNNRLADQVNGALFHGRQVVKPEELEPADAQFVYLGKEGDKNRDYKAVVDKIRLWRGSLIHILAVENQTFVDYHMVLRNMLTESLSYQRQWEHKKAAHKRAQDLKVGTDEFFSGMTGDERFMPIITLVVYCGRQRPWDGARCLHELLEINEDMKGFVTNYRLNLYDCHEHDTFDEYHTGLRQLFEVVRYGDDKEELKRIMEENKEAYSRMDRETRALLEVVAHVKIKEDDKVMGNEEETYDMCKAFVDMKLEGIEEGMQYHLVQTVCIKLRKNKTAEVIADELEEELPEIEKIIAAQKKAGDYNVEEICRLLAQ